MSELTSQVYTPLRDDHFCIKLDSIWGPVSSFHASLTWTAWVVKCAD